MDFEVHVRSARLEYFILDKVSFFLILEVLLGIWNRIRQRLNGQFRDLNILRFLVDVHGDRLNNVIPDILVKIIRAKLIANVADCG